MSIDRERITSHISEIQTSLDSLMKYGKLNRKKMLAKDDLPGSSKFHLLVVIEKCSAICTHIVEKYLHHISSNNNSHCFTILSEKGIIDKKLERQLSKMAKLKSLLIHSHLMMDDKKVYHYIKKDISCVIIYLDVVEDKFLKNNK